MNSHQSSTNGEIQYFGEIKNNEARLCVSLSKMVDDVNDTLSFFGTKHPMITGTALVFFETEL